MKSKTMVPKMRQTFRKFVAVLAMGMLAVPVSARAEVVDRVAAVVNDDIIAMSEVEERAAPELAQIAQEPNAERRTQLRQQVTKQALDALIGERLMEQQLKELQIEVSDQELETGIANVRQQNGMDPAQFEDALAREGLTMEKYREHLRSQLARMKLMDLKVRSKVKLSEQDLKAEYARFSRLESEDSEVHARHILVQVAPNATPAEVEKAKKKAEAIAKEARKPMVDFAALAKLRSEGSSKEEGGDLGFFKRGVMVPEFERIAFNLQEGEVSDPVRTGFGFHVIKVEEKRAVEVPPFEEVKDQMRERLMQEQLVKYSERYVQELRAAAVVEVKI